MDGHLSAARAQDVLTDFDDLPIHRWPSVDGLRGRAFQLRDTISAYDAAYVALPKHSNVLCSPGMSTWHGQPDRWCRSRFGSPRFRALCSG